MTGRPDGMARKKVTKQSDADSRPVVRDATFVRLIADDIVVVNLGRDFELAFVAVGNPITRLTRPNLDEDVVGQEVETRRELTETGRVRISPFSALNAAMNILARLVESGQVDTDLLPKAISEMISSAEQNSQDDKKS